MSGKILFLVAHRPGRSPGQRFRFEQYLDYLREEGFICDVSYLINERDDRVFYASGKYFQKTLFLLKSLRQRWADLKRATQYDVVFLYREAHLLGLTFFERSMTRKGAKMVVDFDDSIWLKDVSNGNRNLAFLKRPAKTAEIVRLCRAVIVGNRYLAEYAKLYNPHVHVIPTTIDTDYYQSVQRVKHDKNPVIIGWTGSSTTLRHFALAIPVLQKLKDKYGSGIGFRLICDEPWTGEPLDGLEFVRWRRESEVADLDYIDIGIMPLPDDAWSRGKCGFKGLQYMALGKVAVMSPVGVNQEIIVHGENGYLANEPLQWYELLCELIENPQLRARLGGKGRETVLKQYSFHSQKEKYRGIFADLVRAT